MLIKPTDHEEDKTATQKELRKNTTVVLGLSRLVQKINSGSLHAAFFSSNLEPKFITRQILTLALNKRPTTLLLVVPNLEDLLDNVFGVKSYSFGLSLDGDLERFADIIDIAKIAASRFAIPVGNGKPSGKVEATVSERRKKPEPLLTKIDFDSLYLKSPGNGKKAWTPSAPTESVGPTIDKSANPGKVVKQWTDFISLNDAALDADTTVMDNITDLTEERNQLKAILLSSAKLVPSTMDQDEEMDCDVVEEEKVEVTKERVSKNSIFLKPEETSGNQWAGLLKPGQVATGVLKLQKKKKKNKESLIKRKESNKDAATFLPMKIHKIQPNPNKSKKMKKKKNKK